MTFAMVYEILVQKICVPSYDCFQIFIKVGCLDEWIQAPVSKKNEQLILVVKFTASAVGIIYTFINPSAD
ncbi:hypothetical protein DERF_003441 [Dermatophagoides farinae]|uniref:Uncharacterized protein n=1 Tax=Dermatophagoides farinae TaxID=6954 RepID=A0A922IH64_DERFA|nr:hypothetical protein DERF_003441 [Dermatophagoides farinae]